MDELDTREHNTRLELVRIQTENRVLRSEIDSLTRERKLQVETACRRTN